jgi:hypothetical protein
MTTTEQQAVTVAQQDREAAADLMEKLFTGVAGLESDLDWANTVRAGEDDEYPTTQAFARHRLASVSSASAEEVGAHFFPDAAAKLHKLIAGSNVEGELPNDVRALVIAAREFWENEDSGTIRSHALDKALEAFSSRVPYADEPTPEPVPATNQAGEVERALVDAAERFEAIRLTLIDHLDEPVRSAFWCAVEGKKRLAALATQPATSQEGEARAKELLWLIQTDGVAAPLLGKLTLKERADIVKAMLIFAATPTPPTLSEDLRALVEALEPFAAACNITTAEDCESLYDSLAAEKLTWRDLRRARAALAQVKAS